MIAIQEFYRFKVSIVLQAAQRRVPYHREVDQRLENPTYGLIGPVSEPVIWFVQDYGIVRLLDGSPYNPVLALLYLYRILELNWVAVTRDSLWSLLYLFYEWKTGAVHPVAEARKLEPMYSNTVLTGHHRCCFWTKNVIYGSDPTFCVHNITYVEHRVCETLKLVTNITEGQIEARLWLNRRRHAGELAPPELHPITTNMIVAQPAAFRADPPTTTAAQTRFDPIVLKGWLWDSVAAIFVKLEMDVQPTAEHLIELIETAFNR